MAPAASSPSRLRSSFRRMRAASNSTITHLSSSHNQSSSLRSSSSSSNSHSASSSIASTIDDLTLSTMMKQSQVHHPLASDFHSGNGWIPKPLILTSTRLSQPSPEAVALQEEHFSQLDCMPAKASLLPPAEQHLDAHHSQHGQQHRLSTTPPSSPSRFESLDVSSHDPPSLVSAPQTVPHAPGAPLETVTECEEEPTLAYSIKPDWSALELEESFSQLDHVDISHISQPSTNVLGNLLASASNLAAFPQRPGPRRMHSTPAPSTAAPSLMTQNEPIEFYGRAISPPSSPGTIGSAAPRRQSIAVDIRDGRLHRARSSRLTFDKSKQEMTLQHIAHSPSAPPIGVDQLSGLIPAQYSQFQLSQSTSSLAQQSMRSNGRGLKSAFDQETVASKTTRRSSKRPSMWLSMAFPAYGIGSIDTPKSKTKAKPKSKDQLPPSALRSGLLPISLPVNARHTSSGALYDPTADRESPFGRRPMSPVQGYISVPGEADKFQKEMAIALIGEYDSSLRRRESRVLKRKTSTARSETLASTPRTPDLSFSPELPSPVFSSFTHGLADIGSIVSPVSTINSSPVFSSLSTPATAGLSRSGISVSHSDFWKVSC